MNTVYTYPPDKSLLREKLSGINFSETPEAWQKFEQYWLQQKPIETPVKKQSRFVGIPLTLILRGFFALALVLISMGLYNTANSELPPVLKEVRAGKSHSHINTEQMGKGGKSTEGSKVQVRENQGKITRKTIN